MHVIVKLRSRNGATKTFTGLNPSDKHLFGVVFYMCCKDEMTTANHTVSTCHLDSILTGLTYRVYNSLHVCIEKVDDSLLTGFFVLDMS